MVIEWQPEGDVPAAGVRYKKTITKTGSTKTPLGGMNVNENVNVPPTGPVPAGFWRDPATGNVIRLPENQKQTSAQSNVLANGQLILRKIQQMRDLRKELSTGQSGMISGPLAKAKGFFMSGQGGLNINKQAALYNNAAESMVNPVVKLINGDVGMITEPDKAAARVRIPPLSTADDISYVLLDELEKDAKERLEATFNGFPTNKPLSEYRESKKAGFKPSSMPENISPLEQELLDNGVSPKAIQEMKNRGDL